MTDAVALWTRAGRAADVVALPDVAVPLAIANGVRRSGAPATMAADDKDPVTRARREAALWVGPRMQAIRDVIEQAARIDVTLLVTGETGTGKELVARAVHYLGTRRAGPFVKVNCAAVARELLESELFRHERGAPATFARTSSTGSTSLRIAMPPLRDRPEEIPLLAAYVTQRCARLFRREDFAFSSEAVERLTDTASRATSASCKT